MNKTYQLKTLDTQGRSRSQTLEAGRGASPLLVPCAPGERHLLLDVAQGSAPDNIRVQRAGRHLRVFFDGARQPDLVLENFYSDNAAAQASLAGVTDQGSTHAYLPETGLVKDTLNQLADNASPQGMALGGEPLGTLEAGAGVGFLAPVAAAGGLGLGAIGAGLLGAAAIAGGGGGGGGASVNPNSAAGTNVLIKSLSLDSGRNASDFITNDNTLVFKGSLEHFTANGDRVRVQLKDSAGKVLHTADLTPTGAQSDQWEWDLSTSTLVDGHYRLEAQLVDASGAAVSNTHSDSQDVQVDTSPTQEAGGTKDPNSDLGLNIVELVRISDGQPTGLVAFYNNAPDDAKFKGSLSASWTNNSDRLHLEIFNQQGTQKVSEFVDVSGTTWSSSEKFLDGLSSGTYILRSRVEDQAGNTVLVDTQTFVIDTRPLSGASVGFTPEGSVVKITLTQGGKLEVKGSSASTYVVYDYSGAEINKEQTLSNESYAYKFTNYAGNAFNGNSGDTQWSGKIVIKDNPDVSNASNTTAKTGDIVYQLDASVATLDLSTLITQKGTSVFNTVDLSGHDSTKLTITAHDLLNIGMTDCFISGTNTFSSDKNYSSDIQFKVKGDRGDVLQLTDLTHTHEKVSLNDGTYAVYHTAFGNVDIDVFVLDSMMVQLA